MSETQSSTYYSPTSNSIGTGMSVNTNYAFEPCVFTEGLLQASASTNGSHYMGKLTYTFSQPVDYPILHVPVWESFDGHCPRRRSSDAGLFHRSRVELSRTLAA